VQLPHGEAAFDCCSGSSCCSGCSVQVLAPDGPEKCSPDRARAPGYPRLRRHAMTHRRFERRAIVQICKNASTPSLDSGSRGRCFVQMRLFASSNPVYPKSNRYGMASTMFGTNFTAESSRETNARTSVRAHLPDNHRFYSKFSLAGSNRLIFTSS
jgi:hypothetical protein